MLLGPSRRQAAVYALVVALLGASCSGGGGGDGPDPPDDTLEEEAEILTEAGVASLNQQTSDGLAQAVTDFEDAVELDPSNELSRTLLALTRLAQFVEDNQGTGTALTQGPAGSALADLLAGFGVDLMGASIFDLFDSEAEIDVSLALPLSDNAPTTGEVQTFLAGELLEVVQLSVTDLEVIGASFSERVEGLFGMDIEFDFGDAQLIAAGLRALEAQLLFQAAFDLDADLDELVNWEMNGLDRPYRIFTGDSPTSIAQGQTWPIPNGGLGLTRRGFLNEATAAQSTSTFLPVQAANLLLGDARLALIEGLDNLVRGMSYVEDPDTSDDLLAVSEIGTCLFALSQTWVDDLLFALKGQDTLIDPVDASDPFDPDCAVSLPGFVLDSSLVFLSASYDGRQFLPDYTVLGSFVPADETSFPFALSHPQLTQLYFDLTGELLTGESMVGFWNGLNETWDTLFFGGPIEADY